MLQRKCDYPSNLTKQQWDLIKNFIPKAKRGGRRRTTKMRSVVNAIFYLMRTGCAWRYLPKTFPPWATVYGYFSLWCELGIWKQISHTLSHLERVRENKNPSPTLGIIDAQTIRASTGEQRGFDGFKKAIGRKRNIIVDSLGLMWSAHVHSAYEQDRRGGVDALKKIPPEALGSMKTILADRGYKQGPFDTAVEFNYGMKLELTMSAKQASNLKPKRWIVERTFAWMMRFRRLVRDYERLTSHSESMLYICMIMIVLNRIDTG